MTELPTPSPQTPSGRVYKDRIGELRWTQPNFTDFNDRLEVYRGKVDNTDDPVIEEDVSSLEELSGIASTDIDIDGVRSLYYPAFIGYGTFWWRIVRASDSADDELASSGVAFRIVPRGVSRETTGIRQMSVRRPNYQRNGLIRFRVTTAPKTRVTMTVKKGGLLIMRRQWTEQTVAARKNYFFRVSCMYAGSFRAVISMRDAHGRQLTKSKNLNVPAGNCVRPKPKPKPRPRPAGSSGGSSGSSGGNRYPGMTCAQIGHDFWVTPGSDPAHDADGDGHACESFA